MNCGTVTYEYIPNAWDQERFLDLGGFTVVFLNYNKAIYIEQSVASVLNQDYPLLELFFMDDASTDGSGDVMERLVRAYHGRHKVTIVRNKENQYITGQWNIVSKLATGNWYGMFCGDDISYPDRISSASKIVEEYPTLLGFCLSGEEYDTLTNNKTGGLRKDSGFVLSYGNDPLGKTLQTFFTIGATAFWHKSLFDNPLPRCPMDDTFLHWLIYLKSIGNPNPVWLFNPNIDTILYSVGSGITSKVIASEKQQGIQNKRGKYRAALKHERYFSSLVYRTMVELIKYAKKYGYWNDAVEPVLHLCEFRNHFISVGTWRRLLLLPKLVSITRDKRLGKPLRKTALRQAMRVFVRDFLGINVASYVMPLLHESRQG